MLNILDCTIRDGSYATNYQWDNEDVRKIVSTLADCGIPFIEVGNGTGLGMYRSHPEAKPDMDYLTNSIPYKKNAKIGVFYIPTIGTYDDIKNFKEEGGDFIRVGVNATETEKAVDAIEYAKSLGLMVSCNLMKTYAITPYQLVYRCREIIQAGSDCIYVVDSAGGMLPEQVADYFTSMRSVYSIDLGFHGHNNLLLANANSYTAARSGATFLDATLQSLGRGAGNAQLESLVALLQKAEMLEYEIDVNRLTELSDYLFEKIAKIPRGSSKRDIVIGVANFHDSYLPLAEQSAQRFGVDVERLIVEVSKINVVNPSASLFDLVAQKISNESSVQINYPKFHHTAY